MYRSRVGVLRGCEEAIPSFCIINEGSPRGVPRSQGARLAHYPRGVLPPRNGDIQPNHNGVKEERGFRYRKERGSERGERGDLDTSPGMGLLNIVFYVSELRSDPTRHLFTTHV